VAKHAGLAPRQRLSGTFVFAPEQLDAMRSVYRATFGRALADWPAEIREPVLHQGSNSDGFRQSLREPMNLPRLFGEVRDAGSEPDVPLTIVAAMGVDSVAKESVPPDAHASLASRI
jgi:hypothetical protein